MPAIYRQCKLTRPTETGMAEDVYWIDNDLAKVNKRVQDEDGVIWTVAEIYNARTIEDVQQTIDLWKRFADVLDIKKKRK